jgi:hypothetical protein
MIIPNPTTYTPPPPICPNATGITQPAPSPTQSGLAKGCQYYCHATSVMTRVFLILFFALPSVANMYDATG